MSELFGLHAPLAQIALRTVIVYVFIVLGIRLTGRRQLGQMTPFDLVLILLISNAVQNAMVGPDSSILGGLVAAGVLLLLNQGAGLLGDRVPLFRKALEGDPILLVNDGQLIENHCQAAGISREVIMQALREHSFNDLSEVHMAILEVDGTISIVPMKSPVVETKRKFRHSRHRARAVRPGGS